MRRETVIFEKSLKKTAFVWKHTGMQICYDEEPVKETFLSYSRKHWFYIVNFILLTTSFLSVSVIISDLSIDNIFYMIPCITFAFLGDIKSFYFLYYENNVRDIIKTLKRLQSVDESREKDEVVHESFQKNDMKYLQFAVNLLFYSGYLSLILFGIGPLMVVGYQYWTTNELHLFLPYSLWYPFNEYDYRLWPLALLHQFWAAWIAMFFVYGPDFFYYTGCTFVHNQFRFLLFDLHNIGAHTFADKDSIKAHIGQLIYRHRELICCVDMIDSMYGKSALFNVISSSVLICLAGFNVTAIENKILMAPFVVFVVITFVQIFLLCYYGDLLMHDSVEVSNAIYSSEWYKLDLSTMKCCLIMLTRAQKPCKITAYGFSDIRLRIFSTILSSAYTYFTLIKTTYSEQIAE